MRNEKEREKKTMLWMKQEQIYSMTCGAVSNSSNTVSFVAAGYTLLKMKRFLKLPDCLTHSMTLRNGSEIANLWVGCTFCCNLSPLSPNKVVRDPLMKSWRKKSEQVSKTLLPQE